MDADDVRQSAAACRSLLGTAASRDWTAPAGGPGPTVAHVVAHLGESLLRLATELAAARSVIPARSGSPERSGNGDRGGDGERPGPTALELRLRPDAAPPALLTSVVVTAEVLAAVVDGAPPGLRGRHRDAAADVSGFAAMACDEILVHTDDAARGLGLVFEPDAHLAHRVLHRLFPWAPRDARSWPTLRWANGRAPLGERPQLREWHWHSAPLGEWDGHLTGR